MNGLKKTNCQRCFASVRNRPDLTKQNRIEYTTFSSTSIKCRQVQNNIKYHNKTVQFNSFHKGSQYRKKPKILKNQFGIFDKHFKYVHRMHSCPTKKKQAQRKSCKTKNK